MHIFTCGVTSSENARVVGQACKGLDSTPQFDSIFNDVLCKLETHLQAIHPSEYRSKTATQSLCWVR